jgi:hypothetical protein
LHVRGGAYDGASQRARRGVVGAREAHQRAHDERCVHGEIPGDEREHRRGEEVDAPTGADAVDREADGQGRERERGPDPAPPAQRADGAAKRRVARPHPLEGEMRPSREELFGAPRLADDLCRGTARPGAIGVRPERARPVGGLDGAHRGDDQRIVLVHPALDG